MSYLCLISTASTTHLTDSAEAELSEKIKIVGGFIGPSVLIVLTVLLGVVGNDGKDAIEALTDSSNL